MINFDRSRKHVFTGCATAVITPFKNGSIDFSALENILEGQIEAGVDAIVVAGTTGEAATLEEKEQKELISFCAKAVSGRIPVIAGVGGCDVAKACRLSAFSADVGADAILAVNPYYNKGNGEGIVQSMNAVANAADIPTILYNVPSRTGSPLTLPIIERLAENDEIVALKEASGSLSFVCELASRLGNRLDIYSGNDDVTVPIMSVGGLGCISVLSNILPRTVTRMCHEYLEGRADEAAMVQLSLIELYRTMFSEVNPVPIKYAMHRLGLCSTEYRLPLSAPSVACREAIEGVLNSIRDLEKAVDIC